MPASAPQTRKGAQRCALGGDAQQQGRPHILADGLEVQPPARGVEHDHDDEEGGDDQGDHEEIGRKA